MDITRRTALGAAATAVGGLLAGTAVGQQPAVPAEKKKKDDQLPNFRFNIEAEKGKVHEGGSAKEATVVEFPISKGLAGVSMRLQPGGMRELHWHAIAAEWAYMLKGRVRGTVIDPSGAFETLD